MYFDTDRHQIQINNTLMHIFMLQASFTQPIFNSSNGPENGLARDCTPHRISVIEWHWMLSAIVMHFLLQHFHHIDRQFFTRKEANAKQNHCTPQSLSITLVIIPLNGKSFHCFSLHLFSPFFWWLFHSLGLFTVFYYIDCLICLIEQMFYKNVIKSFKILNLFNLLIVWNQFLLLDTKKKLFA